MPARFKYAAAVIVCIGLGLGSRQFADILPPLVAEHAGDMLWASMVYFGFRFVGIHRGLAWSAWLSIVFSFAIEFSQLITADWIIRIRNTVLGALILGKGFLYVDLVRYVCGIGLALIIDLVGLKKISRPA
ncbi:ribosomal maturation YjgA family protein [Paenibacillus aestuarii]|uniref:DUF2809 domain-containing protein n=1 Tax=Paenibacillus aestuarii TaxID=516965 RepID=A0ABW0KA00_9BACL|nr:DUF2809 domain-containing protein [Paenibacillus aestuarii]